MQPEEQKPPLKPWILPLMLGSIAVIALGLISAYADLRLGALLALLGLFGVCWAGWAASRGDT